MADTLTQALAYAKEGWPVFPCRPGSKKPLTDHGFKDASTDAERIRDWWRRWPRANVAIATGGETSGIIVVDIDVKNGVNGFEAIAEHGLSSDTFSVETPSGGAHLYFRTHEKWSNRQTWGELPGVDIRGDGGYVLAPPSVLCDDKGKHIGSYIFGNGLPIMFLADTDWPKWLKKKPQRTPSEVVIPAPRTPDERSPFVERAIANEAQKVASERNNRSDALNYAAFCLGGRLGQYPEYESEIVASLFKASIENGHVADDGERAIRATIRSGLEAGRAQPMVRRDRVEWVEQSKPRLMTANGGEVVPIEQAKKKERRTKPYDTDPDAPPWLERNAQGNARSTVHNALSFLRHDSALKGLFKLDEFIGSCMVTRQPTWEPRWSGPRAVCDADYGLLSEYLARRWEASISVACCHEGVRAIAHVDRYDSVIDYLDGLEWDGEPRIDTFLSAYGGCGNEPVDRAISRKWLMATAARMRFPGVKCDYGLTLLGETNLGKTKLIKALFPERKWVMSDVDANQISTNNLCLKQLGKTILFFDEMSGFSSKKINAVKTWMTEDTDTFRRPYDKEAQQVGRRFSCAFASNNRDKGILQDPTGNRRWWIVYPTRAIDAEGAAKIRNQLWAEADHYVRAGEKWHIEDNDPVTEALRARQEDAMQEKPWLSQVRTYLVGKDTTTLDDVLIDAVRKEPKDIKQADKLLAADVLRELGWHRKKHKGVRVWALGP